MDVNGDGKTDLVSRAGSGDLNVWSSTSVFPDLLTSITPTYGPKTTLTYKPLTDATVYTKDNTAVSPYTVSDFQGPMYVVSKVETGNGIVARLTPIITSAKSRIVRFSHI